jgi:serine/threonine-protein kinase
MLFNARYELQSELGRGTVADTHVAHCLETGAQVILKWLRRELSEEAQHIDLFLGAAERASAIVHPNVASVIDYGIDSHGTAYVAIERAKGVNLEALLFDRRLAPGVAIEIAVRVLTGLEACHQASVLHRDIKPRNVLVSSDEQTGHPIAVKITDVGLTESMNDDETCLDRIGWRGDSLRYMASERVEGEAVSERSDIYSAGVLLYEMLVGGPLIRETDELRALDAVRCGRWLRPVALVPELPEALLSIVESALHLDPAQRPRSAGEFAAMLRPFCSHAFAPSAVPAESAGWNFVQSAVPGPYAPSYSPINGSRPVPRPRPDSACPTDMLVDPTFPRSPLAPRLEALHADAFRGSTPSSEPPPMPQTVGGRLGWLVGAGLGFGLLVTFLEVLGS